MLSSQVSVKMEAVGARAPGDNSGVVDRAFRHSGHGSSLAVHVHVAARVLPRLPEQDESAVSKHTECLMSLLVD